MESSPTITLSGSTAPTTLPPEPAAALSSRVTPFLDTVEHTLDSKARVTLPAAVRPAFSEGGVLVLWSGPCIAVLTDDGFDRWIRHLRTVIPAAGYESPGGHIRYAPQRGDFSAMRGIRHVAMRR